MKRLSRLLILVMLLSTCCAPTASLPPTQKLTQEQIVKTHLARPTVNLSEADAQALSRIIKDLPPADAQVVTRLLEALHDLHIESEAVYEDYQKR